MSGLKKFAYLETCLKRIGVNAALRQSKPVRAKTCFHYFNIVSFSSGHYSDFPFFLCYSDCMGLRNYLVKINYFKAISTYIAGTTKSHQ